MEEKLPVKRDDADDIEEQGDQEGAEKSEKEKEV